MEAQTGAILDNCKDNFQGKLQELFNVYEGFEFIQNDQGAIGLLAGDNLVDVASIEIRDLSDDRLHWSLDFDKVTVSGWNRKLDNGLLDLQENSVEFQINSYSGDANFSEYVQYFTPEKFLANVREGYQETLEALLSKYDANGIARIRAEDDYDDHNGTGDYQKEFQLSIYAAREDGGVDYSDRLNLHLQDGQYILENDYDVVLASWISDDLQYMPLDFLGDQTSSVLENYIKIHGDDIKSYFGSDEAGDVSITGTETGSAVILIDGEPVSVGRVQFDGPENNNYWDLGFDTENGYMYLAGSNEALLEDGSVDPTILE